MNQGKLEMVKQDMARVKIDILEISEGKKWYGSNRSILSILRRGGKNTQKNYAKKIFMIQITMMV